MRVQQRFAIGVTSIVLIMQIINPAGLIVLIAVGQYPPNPWGFIYCAWKCMGVGLRCSGVS